MHQSRLRHALLSSILFVQNSTLSALILPSGLFRSNTVNPNRLLQLRKISIATCASASDSCDEQAEDRQDGLALPPIGTSSFWDRPQDEDIQNDSVSGLTSPKSGKNSNNDIIISEHANLVSPKFQIQYTCKICGHRNSHSVTRMAYRKGVVIAMCKGCKTKHWIADHLGWSNHIGGFDFDNGERDIEMYMKNRDHETDCEEENDLVRRVSREVFDLENMLYKEQRGSLLPEEVAEDIEEKGWN